MSEAISIDAPSTASTDTMTDDRLFDVEPQDTGDRLDLMLEGKGDALDELSDVEPESDVEELTVNGEKITMSRDEIKALAQKQIAGEIKLDALKKGYEELKKKESEILAKQSNITQFFNGFAGDLDQIEQNWELMRTHLKGVPSMEEVVAAYVDRWSRVQALSPEERAQYRLEQERQRMQKEFESRSQQLSKAEQEHLTTQYTAMIQRELPTALDEAKLPRNPAIIKRIAEVWSAAAEAGKQPTARQVADYVRRELEKNQTEILAAYSGEELLERLPRDVIEKLNRAAVEKVKASQPKRRANPDVVGTAAVKKQAPKMMGLKEWRAQFK